MTNLPVNKAFMYTRLFGSVQGTGIVSGKKIQAQIKWFNTGMVKGEKVCVLRKHCIPSNVSPTLLKRNIWINF